MKKPNTKLLDNVSIWGMFYVSHRVRFDHKAQNGFSCFTYYITSTSPIQSNVWIKQSSGILPIPNIRYDFLWKVSRVSQLAFTTKPIFFYFIFVRTKITTKTAMFNSIIKMVMFSLISNWRKSPNSIQNLLKA